MLALGRKGNSGVRGGPPSQGSGDRGVSSCTRRAQTRALTRMQVPTFSSAAEPHAPRTAPRMPAVRADGQPAPWF